MFKKNYYLNTILVIYLILSTFLIIKITKPSYGVNDDVIIQNWLSGLYTGSPELMIRGSATPRLIFGFIVSNLYETIPSINWFSIILLGGIILSWYLLGILTLKQKSFILATIYVLVSFLHLLWFIPSPTYTASAVLLSFSTLIFFLKKISDNNFNAKLIYLPIIYALSFLIRPESFLLGSAATMPFILFTLIKNKKLLKKNLTIILTFFFLTFSIIGIDIVVEKIYYQNNSDWVQYKDWEAARYKIQANAPEKAAQENPKKFGWTEAEVEIFKSYNAIDFNYFTTSKLNKLIADTQNSTKINLDFIEKAHQQIFESDINWEWKRLIALISVIFATFLILSLPYSLNYLLLSCSSLLIIYLIMLYVAGFLRQPERVQVSVIFLCIIICMSSYIFSPKKNKGNQLSQYSALGFIIVILVFQLVYNQSKYLKSKVAGASNVFWLTESRYLSTFPSDSIFVGNSSQFRNNWRSPYKTEYFDIENRIFTFGWHNFSPHWVKRAQNLGLDPNNLFKSIIEDPRVYWVSDPESMEYVVTYMKEQNYNFSGPYIVGEMSFVGTEYKVWNFNPND